MLFGLAALAVALFPQACGQRRFRFPAASRANPPIPR